MFPVAFVEVIYVYEEDTLTHTHLDNFLLSSSLGMLQIKLIIWIHNFCSRDVQRFSWGSECIGLSVCGSQLDVKFFTSEIPVMNHKTWVKEPFSDTPVRSKPVLVFSRVFSRTVVLLNSSSSSQECGSEMCCIPWNHSWEDFTAVSGAVAYWATHKVLQKLSLLIQAASNVSAAPAFFCVRKLHVFNHR